MNRVVVHLKRLARDYHSSALVQLASRVGAILQYSGTDGDDPFVKVKGLIQSMIDELTAEAEAQLDTIRQATHAAYLVEKSELDTGIRGVRQALGLLRSYYGKSVALLEDGAKFAALMQQPALPKTHAKATGAGSGIIDILEVVEADFANSL